MDLRFIFCRSFPSLVFSSWRNSFVSLFHRSVMSNSSWPCGLHQARLPCPSLFPGVCSNSCLLNLWCHLTVLSSVIPFSSCPQFFPASGSFLMSQLFTAGGQSIGASASASVLPMNIQDWFPLGLTDLIFLQFKGLSRVFSSTTIQKHQFFSAQPSLGSSWSWRDSSECGVKWDLNSPPRNWTWVAWMRTRNPSHQTSKG